MFRYLTGSEFNIVLERATVFEGKTNCAGRIAAGVVLGLHGLRCGEVCGLHIGDLDAGQGALHVATLKKGRPRRVEIEARIAAWLARIAGRQPASAPLFRTCRGRPLHTSQFQRAWKQLSVRWLGREVRFHCLRHTAAQRLFEATHDLLLVQAFLGHRSLTATLVYASSVGGVRSHMPRLPDVETFQPLLFEAG